MNFFSRAKAQFASDVPRLGFAVVLTVLFLVLAAIGAYHHELWRDEMQAWLIARDVPNISALLEQTHYEGHPPLWILLLRPLTFLTHRPEAMQVLTWVLAGATIFIISYYAPFSRLLKTLLVCNYYLLFEYGIVCRNYLPGILALSVACIFFPSAQERPWPFVISLVVAAFSSVHSLIVAVAMAAAFWGSWAWSAFRSEKERNMEGKAFRILPLLAFIAGTGWAVYFVIPRADTFYPSAAGWHFHWHPDLMAGVSWAFVWSHFPWPRPPGFFWIPPWQTPFPSFDPNLAFVLSAILFFGAIFLLRRHLEALLIYIVGTIGVAAFLYTKYLGFSRHSGFLFLTFLFALWMKKTTDASRGPPRAAWMDSIGEVVFFVMLAMQAITGLWAFREDYQRPFSCGKEVAEFITDHHLQNEFIAAGWDWSGSTVAGYLNRSLYYPNTRHYGSFTHWDTQRDQNVEDEEFFRRAANEAKGASMVIVLDHPLDDKFMQAHGIQLLARFEGSLTSFEDYYVHFFSGKPTISAVDAAAGVHGGGNLANTSK
ncbi:MAG TPA: hypothetical protein VK717_12135 [Opitutaceae bacterium]|jgi:hypothetical protein|nr:hypothetical protein [Opitutaceae bacterium]